MAKETRTKAQFEADELMDSVVDTDKNGFYQGQEAYELEQFQNSLEGRLIEFTDLELLDEYYRRMFAPYNKSLAELKDQVERLTVPF